MRWGVVALLPAAVLAVGPSSPGQVCGSSAGLKAGDTAGLRLIKSPTVPYPEDALKKQIQGKVTLKIVVDEKGRVSDAKALSGPAELLQAAVNSVKQWEFEPPAKAPVVATAEVGYGFPRECPAAVSTMSSVAFGARLKNQHGVYVYVDDEKNATPPYPEEDRKAGAAGEMILALAITPEGKVTKVRVVQSVSANLDKLATETVRGWAVRLQPGGAPSLPDEFLLHISFTPMCYMEF